MSAFIPLIAESLQIRPQQVQATADLLAEGGTVPFIARYRKDHTGALDEVQIRQIQERLEYFAELEARRQTILASIEEQGKLSDSLKQKILAVESKTELEDLYLPYKPKRRTRAQMARENGLEPLAMAIRLQQERSHPADKAKAFVGEKVADTEAALQGARDILAEEIADDAQIRALARESLWKFGVLSSKKAKGADETTKFDDYADFQEPLQKIPSHRYLALRRGEKEKVLKLKVELEAERLLTRLQRQLRRQPNAWGDQLQLALEDSWQRLLLPSLESEIMAELKTKADETAIEIFASNLRALLMAAPLGMRSVIGLDPGLRTGIKCVALSATSQFLANTVLYPLQNQGQAKKLFLDWVARYQPEAIAIGDGTGSRETEQWVRQWLKESGSKAVVVRVSEAGASIYSASDTAREEFPELDLTVRGAISIGRRLQDPLAELVKIEPKSLGVGQYQHDVSQNALSQKLDAVVESCVNQVGVELNTASSHLLQRVAGLGPKLAKQIVAHRDANGPFKARNELKKVKGLGAKTFEQAAGFLRIQQASNPLDRTAVHPEHYALVTEMAKSLGSTPALLIEKPEQLQQLDRKAYAQQVGRHTFEDILAELQKPGRDPRQQFEAIAFREDIQDIKDLEPGMELQGKVTNITAFGAFVDLGVHQDGLVHISQLADRFVKDPHEVVKVGQTLNVKVLEVDLKRRRIQLTARQGR